MNINLKFGKIEVIKPYPENDSSKRVIAELYENRLFLEAIFENAPLAMILVGKNGELLKTNKAAYKIGLNYSDDFIGRQIGNALGCISSYQHDLGCGHGKDCFRCALRTSIKETFDKQESLEKIPLNMLLVKDSVEVPHAFLLSTTYLTFNSTQVVLLVFEDITAIVNAEQALMGEEFRYKQITRAITDYVYSMILDEKGQVQTIHTPACFSITGYKVEEFDADPRLWIDIVYDEDRAAIINLLDNLNASIGKIDIEYRIICKDKTVKWILNTLVPNKIGKRKGIHFDGIIKDITAQKQAEIALGEKNLLFNTLLENLPIGIFVVSKQTNKPIVANKHAIKLLGRGIIPASEIANLSTVYKAYLAGTCLEYPIEDTPIYLGLQGIDSHVDNMEVEQPDGSRILLEIAGSPVLDANNHIIASMVGFYDITERKNSELALRESEKRLSIIFEYSHIGFALTKPHGIIEYMNPAFCRIVGYQPDIDQSIKLPLLFDTDNDQDFINELRTKQKSFINIERQFLRYNGETIWIQLQVSCFRNYKDEIVNFIAIAEDITERKRALEQLRLSEEKFRNIFNNSNDAILITDFESRILEVNSISLNRSGLEAEVITKLKLIDLINPADKEEALSQFKKLKENGSGYFQTHYVNTRGEIVFIEINARVIDFNGQQRALLISRDLTERKLTQQKIMNAIIEAEEKERTNFSQELHDGIGPLLSTIKLYLQWIKDPNSKTDKEGILLDALETIEEAIVSIKEVSNRLSPNVLRTFGLRTALQSYVKKIENLGKITFNVDMKLPGRFAPEVETMLYRVLIETINNAIKYADASVVDVKIKFDDNRLEAMVCDNGKGFDIESVLQQKAGNGLINMQNRLQTFQGGLSILSEIGKGTEIKINIPVQKYFNN